MEVWNVLRMFGRLKRKFESVKCIPASREIHFCTFILRNSCAILRVLVFARQQLRNVAALTRDHDRTDALDHKVEPLVVAFVLVPGERVRAGQIEIQSHLLAAFKM